MGTKTLSVGKVDTDLLDQQLNQLHEVIASLNSHTQEAGALNGIANLLSEMLLSTASPKKPPCCAICGGTDLELEALVTWDTVNQCLEVGELRDKGHYCRTCDSECKLN